MSFQTIFWIIILAVIVFLFTKNLKQVIIVTGGHALYEIWNFSWDWILWPIVIAKTGWVGFVYLTVIAFITNIIVLWFYQRTKVDWLGVSVLEGMKDKAAVMSWKRSGTGMWYQPIHWLTTAVFKILMWVMRSDVATFIIMSCWEDSFVATAFLRKGRFGSLTKRDLVIFTMSTLFSCVFWALVTGMFIIPSVTHVWQAFF